jgi:hypothetical protein
MLEPQRGSETSIEDGHHHRGGQSARTGFDTEAAMYRNVDEAIETTGACIGRLSSEATAAVGKRSGHRRRWDDSARGRVCRSHPDMRRCGLRDAPQICRGVVASCEVGHLLRRCALPESPTSATSCVMSGRGYLGGDGRMGE